MTSRTQRVVSSADPTEKVVKARVLFNVVTYRKVGLEKLQFAKKGDVIELTASQFEHFRSEEACLPGDRYPVEAV